MIVDELAGVMYRTVFDVGGSVGAFAEAAHDAWPDAAVYSFEPRGSAASENATRSRGRWATVGVALADSAGFRTLQVNCGAGEASTLLEPGSVRREAFGAADEVHVPVVVSCKTLDDYLEWIQPPALLKIDVEGAEQLVLCGGRYALPRFATVIVEVSRADCFLGAASPAAIDAQLASSGFIRERVVDELLDPRDGSRVQADVVYRAAGMPRVTKPR